jgi:hypothetical protein
VSEELDELIEMARKIRMTPAQAERQRRSFAYGNVKIENDSITWEMIDRAAEGLEKRWAGDLLLVQAGGFAVPESVFWSLWHDWSRALSRTLAVEGPFDYDQGRSAGHTGNVDCT